ncbi:MAG: transposase [Bacteroidetes bacterium]|nr:MAG: transposase [Bacteroidota bacterium]
MSRRRYELTDDEWSLIEPHLPTGKSGDGKRGRPRADNRQVLNGIIWILRSGAPWRDLPDRYGPFTTVYTRFRELLEAGVFGELIHKLQLEGQVDSSFGYG